MKQSIRAHVGNLRRLRKVAKILVARVLVEGRIVACLLLQIVRAHFIRVLSARPQLPGGVYNLLVRVIAVEFRFTVNLHIPFPRNHV